MIRVRVAGEERWAAIEDAGRLRDALGVLAAGRACRRPSSSRSPDPLGDLVGPLRPHPRPVHGADGGRAGAGSGPAVVARRPAPAGRVGPARRGRAAADRDRRRRHGPEFCDAEVLRTAAPPLARRAARRGRAGADRPTSPASCRSGRASGGRLRGRDGLLRAVEQLAGAVRAGQRPGDAGAAGPGRRLLPGPARRADGRRRGALARPRLAARRRRLGRRCTSPTPRTLTLPGPTPTGADRRRTQAVLDALAGGGASSSARCPTRSAPPTTTALRRRRCGTCLVGPGHQRHPRPAAGPAGRRPHRAPAAAAPAPRRRRYAGRPRRSALGRLGAGPGRPALPAPHRAARRSPAAGRCCRRPSPTRPLRAYATAELLLDRLRRRHPRRGRRPRTCRRLRRGLPGAAAAEEAGRVRRGYFVEGLGAAQFGTTGRGRPAARGPARSARRGGEAAPVTAAATRRRRARRQRPGQPLRRRPAVAGPRRRPEPTAPAMPPATAPASAAATSPAARPGALVVLVDGDARPLRRARRQDAAVLVRRPRRCSRPRPTPSPLAVREGSLGRLTVEKADGGQLLGSGHPVVAALEDAGFHAHAARAAAAAVMRGARGRHRAPHRRPARRRPAPAPWSSGPTCAGRRVPDVDLRGSRTLEVVARGKHLLHRLDTGATLHTHLRMEGQWRVEHPGERHRPAAAPPGPAGGGAHRRAGRRSACAWACSTSCRPPASHDLVGHLGPDVLGPRLGRRGRGRRASRHPSGSIGDTLLDQRVLAGVGTFWASEILFLERVLPWTPAARPRPRPGARACSTAAAPADGHRHAAPAGRRAPASSARARRPTCTRGRGGRAGAAATRCGWR